MSIELSQTNSKGRSKEGKVSSDLKKARPSFELPRPSFHGWAREKTTSQEECDQVCEAVKRWKAHDGAVLIPVVRKDTMALVQEKAKPRWWKKQAKSTLCVTTPEHLQREIDSTASDGQVQELFLLVSRQVDLPELQFDVPEGIDSLYIIRCHRAASSSSSFSSAKQRASPHPEPTNDKLLLNGQSTFCGVRLDEWQTKRAGAHNLILGPGVLIQLRGGVGIPWTARDALGALSKAQREQVTRHLRDLCDAKLDGAPQWATWKGPVNKLLDVAAGSASASEVVECYAGGIVVQAAARAAELGVDGLLKVAAGLLVVPAGPGHAVLAGVGIAAAVYFVPWDTVWGWFRAAFGALLTWLMRAWENLTTWVLSTAAATTAGAGTDAVECRLRPPVVAG